MLDRIDYNVERMAVDVKAADKELTIATGYQRRSTKRKVILLLLLLVAGMLILLLVKPKRNRPPAAAPAPIGPPDPGLPPVALSRKGRLRASRTRALEPRHDWRRRDRRVWQIV